MKFFLRAQKAGFTLPDFSQNRDFFPNTQCKILDGKLLSAHFVREAQKLGMGRKIPCLAVILVGDNPASQVYVKNKIKIFNDSGFVSQSYFITGTEITEQNVISCIEKLNADKNVHGILVQLPLPKGLNVDKILNHIHPAKDVDGFLPSSMGALAVGVFDRAIACTPLGVMVMLRAYGISLAGKNAVVVGRSNIVGKPMALLLLSSDATVTIAHSKTERLPEICRNADILVAAAGSSEMIRSEYVKPGAIVIDVGIHKNVDGKLSGDVHPDVKKSVAALSPVPGGVGPMTIAMLMLNTALAAWEAQS